jgi:4-hydroxybenzoate polyprenyltransferase
VAFPDVLCIERRRRVRDLVRAAHIGPGLAVVVLGALLAVASGLSPSRVLLVALAVLAGQLSVGWSNDLVDEARDRAVGRADKPLAADDVGRCVVLVACALSVVAVIALSFACGWRAGLVHLAAVASAWAYNLGLKSTAWSWAPYAFSFGSLVVFVSLAGAPPQWPPWWLPAVGALLGVAAHLLNVLPDLEDDARTGVRGLPHRLGPRLIPRVAVAVLLLATVLLALGAGIRSWGSVLGLVVACLLTLGVLGGSGRTPFVAAILIAFTDVLLLLATT